MILSNAQTFVKCQVEKHAIKVQLEFLKIIQCIIASTNEAYFLFYWYKEAIPNRSRTIAVFHLL